MNWTFRPKSIFLLTFQNQDPDQGVGTVDLPQGDNNVTCDAPDGMSVTANVTTVGSETLTFRNSRAVDDQKFSAVVKASLNVEMVRAEPSFSIASMAELLAKEKAGVGRPRYRDPIAAKNVRPPGARRSTS